MLCHYKLAGPLLFLLFLRACICVNSSTMAGVCEVNGILLGEHRFEEGVLVLMFLSTDLKKTQLVKNFNSTMIFTAVS